MKIQVTDSPELEIPDPWIEVTGFNPALLNQRNAYAVVDREDVVLLALKEIKPPVRASGVEYFTEERMNYPTC